MQANDISEGEPCRDDTRWNNATIPEDVLDELDARGVPNELIQFWAEQEAKVLSPTRSDKIMEFLPTRVREAALRFLADFMGLQQSGVLDAALLLDLYCFLRDASIETLPATCVAVVTVLMKSNDSHCHVCMTALAGHASQFAKFLNRMGYTTSAEVTSRRIMKQEAALLGALGWHINAPSMQKWMLVLCDRFDIISSHKYTAPLEWVYKKCVTTAGVLVTQVAASSMPSQAMTNGLFITYLITGRMLSLDALRPPEVTASAWEALFVESQGTLPSCALPVHVQTEMVRTLQLATSWDLTKLQATLRDTLAIMKHVFMTMQARIGSRSGSPQKSVI